MTKIYNRGLRELWRKTGLWKYHCKEKWGSPIDKECQIKTLKCTKIAKIWSLSNGCLDNYDIPPVAACWSCKNHNQSAAFQRKRASITNKMCIICKIVKPKSEFTLTKKGQLPSYCRECASETIRLRNIMRDFGISKEKYASMLQSQNNCCAICGIHESQNVIKSKHTSKSKRLAVDHDHKTGMVRSLLCSKCNNGLGYFNDDINVLKNAIKYLNQHATQNMSSSIPQ